MSDDDQDIPGVNTLEEIDDMNESEETDNGDNSSSEEEIEENLLEEQDNTEEVQGSRLLPLTIATVTCLHKYAISRMEGAVDKSLPWPPLMLVIITYLNRKYQRHELVTERNLAMLELLLDVPIQLQIKRGTHKIDLNDDSSLDFSGMSFVEALEILRDLRSLNVIKDNQIRKGVLKMLN